MKDYYITDGERYIYKNHEGKYLPGNGAAMGELFSKQQAEHIIKNSLPKAMRKLFRVVKATRQKENMKMVSETDLSKTEKVKTKDNIQRWMDRIADLNGLATDAKHRREVLAKELTNIEKELTDISHYIEFVNLNASQGYHAYKMIKERRIKRRTIKNELAVLEIILSKKISETVEGEIKKRISGMDKRKYEPRVLKELFDL